MLNLDFTDTYTLIFVVYLAQSENGVYLYELFVQNDGTVDSVVVGELSSLMLSYHGSAETMAQLPLGWSTVSLQWPGHS